MLTSSRTLWVRCSGPFSANATARYAEAIKAAAVPLSSAPWTRVNDLRDWELMTPDSLKPLSELMAWCEAHNLAQSINIMANEALQTFALDKMMEGVERQSQRYVTTDLHQTLEFVESIDPGCDSDLILTSLYPDA